MVRRGKQDEGMPATGAGLIRYFDEETHGPKLDPKVVVGGCSAAIIFEILLHAGIIV